MTNSLQIHALGPYGPAEKQQHPKPLDFTGVFFTTDKVQNRSDDCAGARLTFKLLPPDNVGSNFLLFHASCSC